jgi:hypothetical protein
MGWNATRAQGDADADRDVDLVDLTAWKTEFGGLAAGPSADFDGNGQVNAADLAAWRGGYGTAANAPFASGDADLDHDVDGADFLTWQRTFAGGGAGEIVAASAAESASSGASAAALTAGGLGLDMLSGLSGFEAGVAAAETPMGDGEGASPEISVGMRDGAFGSIGGGETAADGGWGLEPAAAAADAVETSIDECLGKALGNSESWRFISRGL